MNKLYLLASKLGWLVLMVALAGCALSSTPEVPTAPPATQTPGVTQIPPPATHTPSPTLQAQAVAPSPTSAPSTSTLTPTPLIPPCAFANREAEPTELSLDAYVFSEPQVVLTHTTTFDIVGWSLDNRRLILNRRSSGTVQLTVETFDVQTGESHIYADQVIGGGGFELSQQQTIAYFDPGQDGNTALWVSYGNPDEVELLLENVTAPKVTVDPAGYVIVLSQNVDNSFHLSEQASQFFQMLSLPFDPEQWRYPKYPENLQAALPHSSFRVVRRPDNSQIAFYSTPWLFLADTRTYQVCEVDLGWVGDIPRRATLAKWSPDGRYLAMRTTADSPGEMMPFSHLTVLDTLTGGLYQPDLGIQYVWEVDWSHNSQHIVAMGEVDSTPEGRPIQKLALVDVAARNFRLILPDHTFGGGSGPSRQLAWSPDGQTLAVKCLVQQPDEPSIIQDRLCLISISLQH